MQRIPLVVIPDDVDGFTCAWLMKGFKGLIEVVTLKKGAHLLPLACKGRDVWIFGMTVPRDELIAHYVIPSLRTTVIDHTDETKQATDGIMHEMRNEHRLQRTADRFIVNKVFSAAGIAYDFLEDEVAQKRGYKSFRPHGRRVIPLVDYVEDGHLDRFALPNSQDAWDTIVATPKTFEDWDKLAAEAQTWIQSKETSNP